MRPNTDGHQDNRRKRYADRVGEPSDTLFIGNLFFDADEDAITAEFTLRWLSYTDADTTFTPNRDFV